MSVEQQEHDGVASVYMLKNPDEPGECIAIWGELMEDETGETFATAGQLWRAIDEKYPNWIDIWGRQSWGWTWDRKYIPMVDGQAYWEGKSEELIEKLKKEIDADRSIQNTTDNARGI